jgi:hypothetical protein
MGELFEHSLSFLAAEKHTKIQIPEPAPAEFSQAVELQDWKTPLLATPYPPFTGYQQPGL